MNKKAIRKIAVCDDEKQILRQIADYLKQIEAARKECFDILYYSSGDELIQFMPDDIDILLLDISMGSSNGLEAAKKLREKGFDSIIIFITGMAEYALKAFDVHAFSFLVKPIIFSDLNRCLEDAFRRLDKDKEAVIILEDKNGSSTLRLKDIIYAEVYQHTSIITSADQKKEYRISLNSIEEMIDGQGFFRCHKSYLVNMLHISRISFDDIVMDNGDIIPLSKYRRRDFLAAYSRMIGVDL